MPCNVLPCIVFVPDLILQHIMAVPLLYFSSNSHVRRQFQQNTTSLIVAKAKERLELKLKVLDFGSFLASRRNVLPHFDAG